MRKILGSMMIAGLLVAGTACGGDDGGSTDATAAAAESTGGDSGDSGGSAEVDEYCTQVQELADELKKVMADPTSGDVTALMTEANELSTAAAGLVTANPDDVERINECTASLTESMAAG